MKDLKDVVENFLNGERNEYRYYGLRAHHNKETVVGEFVSHNSSDWQTETELDGVCAIDVLGMCQRNEDSGVYDADEIYDDILSSANLYMATKSELILIGSDDMSYGEDRDEIVIFGKRVA